MSLQDIDTIVIAMMENRSFDHMLGYLSLDETVDPMPVEGLKLDPAWRSSFANVYRGTPYEVKPLPVNDRVEDPAHSSVPIAMQISTPPQGPGPTLMGGFVESYVTYSVAHPPARANFGAVMGYYGGQDVTTFDFFARNFCVCDHWFSPLPLGTQANRLMAMAGESKLVDNGGFPMPDHVLAYDWLTDHGIKWRVYQSGGFFPFFTLMLRWLPEIVTSLTLSSVGAGGGRFRRYKRLRKDWAKKNAAPGVIFVEPQYGDGPHKNPNDDHPPTGIGPGQALLLDVYRILISNPERWAKTLLIVTYDEHGAFFDHVPPLPMRTMAGNEWFKTTGVRVPALLISPHVGAGHVFSEPLDHTSILQLLDDRFGGGAGYSVDVARRAPSLGRLAHALLQVPRADASPKPPLNLGAALMAVGRAMVARLVSGVGGEPTLAVEATVVGEPAAPDTPNALALDEAMRKPRATIPICSPNRAGRTCATISAAMRRQRPRRPRKASRRSGDGTGHSRPGPIIFESVCLSFRFQLRTCCRG